MTNTKILTGDQAIAYGALEAGVRVVTGYPGSPSTKVLEAILELSGDKADRHIEWSINEKVAFEVALGASLGGERALVCLKSVGMNIAVDPIMTANLTGVNAGLVILLGDDPGAWLSQNEQDTRLLVDLLELPLLEPSSPQEGKDMMIEAFDLSEEFQTVVIVREIRSFSVVEEEVRLSERTLKIGSKGFVREKDRWISTTFNVLENHRKLHNKLDKIGEKFDNSPFNKIIDSKGSAGASPSRGNGELHAIAAGFSYSKLIDALGNDVNRFSILKLGAINPLPKNMITDFLSEAKRVIVLEDNEPYVENKIKAIAHDAKLYVEVLGKTTGHIPREGELSEEDISILIEQNRRQVSRVKPEVSGETRKSFCEGCPYTPTFEALSQVIKELGLETIIIAEPGCGVKLSAPPFEMLDVKYSMGSAIGIASGLARTTSPTSGKKAKVIAVCGDSSFFHTGVNGLINVIENRANVFILVLDNSVTALTGYQPHPGTGMDARGQKTQAVSIAELAEACHVPSVTVVKPGDAKTMKEVFRAGLASDELSLIVVREPCPLAKT